MLPLRTMLGSGEGGGWPAGAARKLGALRSFMQWKRISRIPDIVVRCIYPPAMATTFSVLTRCGGRLTQDPQLRRQRAAVPAPLQSSSARRQSRRGAVRVQALSEVWQAACLADRINCTRFRKS